MLWFPFLPRDLPCRSRLPGVRLCARAALRVLPRHARLPGVPLRPPRCARLPGGAPVRPRRASSCTAPVCRGCACAPAPRVLPRHAYARRAAAPAQSYWQNATSFFVWYTVSTNCRSSGESV